MIASAAPSTRSGCAKGHSAVGISGLRFQWTGERARFLLHIANVCIVWYLTVNQLLNPESDSDSHLLLHTKNTQILRLVRQSTLISLSVRWADASLHLWRYVGDDELATII